jgi:hypothetical protein
MPGLSWFFKVPEGADSPLWCEARTPFALMQQCPRGKPRRSRGSKAVGAPWLYPSRCPRNNIPSPPWTEFAMLSLRGHSYTSWLESRDCSQPVSEMAAVRVDSSTAARKPITSSVHFSTNSQPIGSKST